MRAARSKSAFRRCRITTMCRERRSRRWPAGYSLWVGAGQKPAEYKGVAQFVSFLMEPDLQVELSAVAGFLPMTSAARAAAGSKLLKADTAGLNVAYAQLQGPGALRVLRVSENRAGADHHRRGTRSRLVRQDAGQAGARQRCPAGQCLLLAGAPKALAPAPQRKK
ncbi:hypothetical protein [Candidatus Accumulibacter contiguus]|uniref:hypothetical protein n=1 Tax=Candidatus Accumulibacter contiguus TaxID=2954381 RepID=UPI002FC34989